MPDGWPLSSARIVGGDQGVLEQGQRVSWRELQLNLTSGASRLARTAVGGLSDATRIEAGENLGERVGDAIGRAIGTSVGGTPGGDLG